MPAGTYPTETAAKAGFDPSTTTTIVVPNGGTATRNFTLTAAATNGQGVAAARYYQQSQPEYFTSKGGATILFSPSGDPIAPQTRQSPQVTAVDGSNTTFFYAGSFDPEAG